MTKIKKIVLSLSVALIMTVALIIGIVCNLSTPKTLVDGGGDYKF